MLEIKTYKRRDAIRKFALILECSVDHATEETPFSELFLLQFLLTTLKYVIIHETELQGKIILAYSNGVRFNRRILI